MRTLRTLRPRALWQKQLAELQTARIMERLRRSPITAGAEVLGNTPEAHRSAKRVARRRYMAMSKGKPPQAVLMSATGWYVACD